MCQTSPFRSAPCDGSEFMTKRTLYARGRVALTFAVLVSSTTATTAVPAFGQSSEAPCAACIVLVAAPGQSVLAAAPLNGLEILVAAEGADPASVASAAAAVANAGGRPGLFVNADTLHSLQFPAGLHRIVVSIGPS